ncbi:MAG: ROK family protein, partial [Nitriliruptoraceae bacterium]
VARGVDDVLMFTLGTGVGGGIVAGGRPLLGAVGFAGEVGHVEVDPAGRPCTCGLIGCLEAYTSATSIARMYAERRDTHDGEPWSASQVAHAAREGDVAAQEVVAHAADRLGRVAAALVTVLDPGVIVLGGGAGPALAPLMAPVVVEQLRAHAFGVRHRRLPDVRAAALGDDAGIVGAGLIAAHEAARMSAPSRPTDQQGPLRP